MFIFQRNYFTEMLGFHFYWTEQYQINFANSEAIKNQ